MVKTLKLGILSLSILLVQFGLLTGVAQGNDAGSNDGPGNYYSCGAMGITDYTVIGSDGSTVGFGSDPAGKVTPLPSGVHLDSPVVGVVQNSSGPTTIATSKGGVYYYNAPNSGGGITELGGLIGTHLNAPIVGIATGGDGFYLAAADGGVFAVNGAPFYGSMGGQHLNAPIVGIESTQDGYYLVAADGGVFTFGNAPYLGSMGGTHLNAPIVGMAAGPNDVVHTPGYYLVASDGGIFSFGTAQFYGSTGGLRLNQPIVGMAVGDDVSGGIDANNDGGYWLVARDGGIFSFGDTQFCGSAVGKLGAPIAGMASESLPPNFD